jgi:hypothetical protein
MLLSFQGLLSSLAGASALGVESPGGSLVDVLLASSASSRSTPSASSNGFRGCSVVCVDTVEAGVTSLCVAVSCVMTAVGLVSPGMASWSLGAVSDRLRYAKDLTR